MFSMDYIIPAIDLTGSMGAVQAGREVGAIILLLIFLFTPELLRVKVAPSSTCYPIYYCCFFFTASVLMCLTLVTKHFNHLSPRPQTGTGGGRWGIVTYLFYWPWIYPGALLSVFGNQDYFHTMIVLGEKLSRSSRAGATNWSIYFGWRDLVFPQGTGKIRKMPSE